jgi:hypothetical protein
MSRAPAFGLLALLIALSSCGTQTALETSWRIPHQSITPMTKLAVIGVLKSHQQSTGFESAVAATFNEHGVEAVPGFSFLKGEKNLDKAEMEQRVATTGADGVLIFKVIAIDRSQQYVPPTTFITPGGFAADWWNDLYWGYWYPAVQVVSTPGYWETYRNFRVESALYRTSDNKLVWTGISETYDPSSQVDLGASLSKVVLEALEKDGLVR